MNKQKSRILHEVKSVNNLDVAKLKDHIITIAFIKNQWRSWSLGNGSSFSS